MMLLRRAVFKVQCCTDKKPPNPVQKARKTFEKKRGDSLKENVNKLIAIANKDIKEYGDFIKELDEIHKKELNKKKKAPTPTDSTTTSSSDEEEYSIFLDKSTPQP